MRNILLTVSYDGTDFCGWQRQETPRGAEPVRTVQGELEAALEKLHRRPVTLYGSGRTDSGVHAAGQAASFFSPVDSIPERNYARALNGLLPPDVRVLRAEERPQDFNARSSATSRIYRYLISCGEGVSAVGTRYTWRVNHSPDPARLNEMVSCLRGETDCASFAAAGDGSVSTFRYIENARFFTRPSFFGGDLLVFELEANAFLWKMVRTVTGTLIQLDRDGKPPAAFREILEARDRRAAGVTAPARGLFLWRVRFDGVRRHV